MATADDRTTVARIALTAPASAAAMATPAPIACRSGLSRNSRNGKEMKSA